MSANLPPGVVPLDMPLEFNCGGCGRNQVLDPEALRAMMRRRRFRCHRCRRRRPTTELAGIGWAADHVRLVGICRPCSLGLPATVYVAHQW